MIVKINGYYNTQIDRVQEGYIHCSPYFFLIVYIMMIAFESMFISVGLHIIAWLLYAIPLFIGGCFELLYIVKYNKANVGVVKVRRLLQICMIRYINIAYIAPVLYLYIGRTMSEYNIDYAGKVSLLLIGMMLLSIVVFCVCFIIGMKNARSLLKRDKKLQFQSVVACGAAGAAGGVTGAVLLRSMPFGILVTLSFFLIAFCGVGTGRGYYCTKHFDKKVFEDDEIIDYEFKDLKYKRKSKRKMKR